MTPLFGAISGAARETRLLFVTLLVSVVLLLVLAQFRFPNREAIQPQVAPVAAPLERISATATYDELARILADVDRRVSSSIVVLETVSASAGRSSPDAPSRVVPALRIHDDMGLVALQPDEQVLGIVGLTTGPPEFVGRDEVRGLAVVRIPSTRAPTLPVASLNGEEVRARYLAVVEASRAGASVRPLFLSRTDPVRDLRWPEPLTSLGGGFVAPPGSFVFTFRGEFVGVVTTEAGQLAVVPAQHVLAVAERLATGESVHQGDIGVTWQRLTPALARATGAATGALVGSVDPAGPAAGILEPGDVVTRVDDRPVRSTVDARMAAASIAPGDSAQVQVLRGGSTVDATLVSRHASDTTGAEPVTGLGLELQRSPDGLLVRRVAPASAGHVAGLEAGDVVTRVDRAPATTPDLLTRAWDDAPSGHTWLLVISRAGSSIVLALQKP